MAIISQYLCPGLLTKLVSIPLNCNTIIRLSKKFSSYKDILDHIAKIKKLTPIILVPENLPSSFFTDIYKLGWNSAIQGQCLNEHPIQPVHFNNNFL